MEEICELLVSLSGIISRMPSKSLCKEKNRQVAVFRWLRGLDSEFRTQIQKSPGSAKGVSDLVGLLQFALVMDNRSIESIFLSWDPQGRPMIPKNKTSIIETEYYKIKAANVKILSCTYILWDGASPEELYISSNTDVIPLILALSNGNCFTRMPKDFNSIREVAWLRFLPRFTIGQYVAGLIELAIWQAWHNPRAIKPSSSKAQQIRHALVRLSQTYQTPTLMQQLCQKEIKMSVTDIFASDDGKIPALVGVMRQRLRRSYDCPYSSALMKSDIQKLWMLHAMNACTSYKSWLDESSPRRYSSFEFVHDLVGVGIMDSYSPIHEFRCRVRDRLLAASADLASRELIRMMEVAGTLDQSNSNSNSNSNLNGKSAKQRRNQRKKKSQNSKLRKLSPSGFSSVESSSHSSTDLPLVPEQNSSPHYLLPSILEVSIPPSEVTMAQIQRTQVQVLVKQLLDEILNDVMHLCFPPLVITTTTLASSAILNGNGIGNKVQIPSMDNHSLVVSKSGQSLALSKPVQPLPPPAVPSISISSLVDFPLLAHSTVHTPSIASHYINTLSSPQYPTRSSGVSSNIDLLNETEASSPLHPIPKSVSLSNNTHRIIDNGGGIGYDDLGESTIGGGFDAELVAIPDDWGWRTNLPIDSSLDLRQQPQPQLQLQPQHLSYFPYLDSMFQPPHPEPYFSLVKVSNNNMLNQSYDNTSDYRYSYMTNNWQREGGGLGDIHGDRDYLLRSWEESTADCSSQYSDNSNDRQRDLAPGSERYDDGAHVSSLVSPFSIVRRPTGSATTAATDAATATSRTLLPSTNSISTTSAFSDSYHANQYYHYPSSRSIEVDNYGYTNTNTNTESFYYLDPLRNDFHQETEKTENVYFQGRPQIYIHDSTTIDSMNESKGNNDDDDDNINHPSNLSTFPIVSEELSSQFPYEIRMSSDEVTDVTTTTTASTTTVWKLLTEDSGELEEEPDGYISSDSHDALLVNGPPRRLSSPPSPGIGGGDDQYMNQSSSTSMADMKAAINSNTITTPSIHRYFRPHSARRRLQPGLPPSLLRTRSTDAIDSSETGSNFSVDDITITAIAPETTTTTTLAESISHPLPVSMVVSCSTPIAATTLPLSASANKESSHISCKIKMSTIKSPLLPLSPPSLPTSSSSSRLFAQESPKENSTSPTAEASSRPTRCSFSGRDASILSYDTISDSHNTIKKALLASPPTFGTPTTSNTTSTTNSIGRDAGTTSPGHKSYDPMTVILSCACLRAQSEASVLLNQLAVQRSLIGTLESSISGQLQPFFIGHEARSLLSGNPALEVMSDEGDSQPFLRRGASRGNRFMTVGIESNSNSNNQNSNIRHTTSATGTAAVPMPIAIGNTQSPYSLRSTPPSITDPMMSLSLTIPRHSMDLMYRQGGDRISYDSRAATAAATATGYSLRDRGETHNLGNFTGQELNTRRPPSAEYTYTALGKSLSFVQTHQQQLPPLPSSSSSPPLLLPPLPQPFANNSSKAEGINISEYKNSPNLRNIDTTTVPPQCQYDNLPVSTTITSSSSSSTTTTTTTATACNSDVMTTSNISPTSSNENKAEVTIAASAVLVSGLAEEKSKSSVLTSTSMEKRLPTTPLPAIYTSASTKKEGIQHYHSQRKVPIVHRRRRSSQGNVPPDTSAIASSDDEGLCSSSSSLPPIPGPGPSPATAVPYHLLPGLTVTGRLSNAVSIQSILTKQIIQFVTIIDRLESAHHSAKTEAVIKVRAVVQSLWPRAQVKPFGSFVIGLSLPSSDLDLVICLPKVQKLAGPEAPGALEGRNAIKETWQQNLARYLRKEDWVDEASITVIPNATVPLLKLQTRAKPGERAVSLDISFEGQGHRGLEASKLHSMLLRQYPALRPLVLVLKCFLTRRGLCEAYTGGLSSYALQLITVRFLQEQLSAMDVGALLLGILNFFGDHVDPRVTGISVARRCYFSRSGGGGGGGVGVVGASSGNPRPESLSMTNDRRQSAAAGINGGSNHSVFPGSISYAPFEFDPLFVEDPLLPGNNVGRNCFRIYQVQRIWSETHTLLINDIRRMEEEGGICLPLLELLVGKFDDICKI